MSAWWLRSKGWLVVCVAVVLAAGATTALAHEDEAHVHDESGASVVTRPDIPGIWWVAPIGAVIALIFAYKFYGEVKRSDPGDEDMIRIAGYVLKINNP